MPLFDPMDPERTRRRVGLLGLVDQPGDLGDGVEIGLGDRPDDPAAGHRQVGGHDQQGPRPGQAGPSAASATSTAPAA